MQTDTFLDGHSEKRNETMRFKVALALAALMALAACGPDYGGQGSRQFRGTGMEIPDRAAAVSGIRAAQPEDTALAGSQASAS